MRFGLKCKTHWFIFSTTQKGTFYFVIELALLLSLLNCVDSSFQAMLQLQLDNQMVKDEFLVPDIWFRLSELLCTIKFLLQEKLYKLACIM